MSETEQVIYTAAFIIVVICAIVGIIGNWRNK